MNGAAAMQKVGGVVVGCCLFIATFLIGCVRYEPKPLERDAVEQALAVPSAEQVRQASAQLRHPALPASIVDLSSALSPEQVAILAVVNHPDLRAQRDRRALADAQVLQAGLLPNPQLTAGIDPPIGGPDDFTAYNVGVDWEITSLIGRKERRHAAAAEAQSVQLDVAWKEWQTAQAAKSAAYDVLTLRAQLQHLQAVQQQLEENRNLLHRAVERHNKTVSDLAAADAAADDAQQAVLTARGDLRLAVLALNRAVGLPPDARLLLQSEDLPPRITPPDPARLLGDFETRRLDLLALQKGYESQDATLRAAVLAQFPKISLGFNTARDTSDVRTLGFGVTVDIPLFDRNQGVIATETATRDQLFDEYASRVLEARSDIAKALANIESINDQMSVARRSLPVLEKLVSTYQQATQRGDVDALSLYSAQANLLQKRIDVAKLQQQLMQNWVALEIAAGQYLPHTAASTQPSTAPSMGRPS